MNTSAPIEVSVVVPMYQSGSTVGQTIESALADFDRSRVVGEVVVVNDGSSDAGPALVEAIAGREARVRLVHRDNGGLSAARNTGLAHARGRFVRFLDADDLAVPGGLAPLVACARAAGAACGGQELIDESGKPMGRELSPRTGPDRTVGPAQLEMGNAMGVGAVLIARELLGERPFDESLPVCEDWDLWLRLARDGVLFAALPAWHGPVKRYRVRSGSLSKRFGLMQQTGARVLGRVDDLDVNAGMLGLATSYGTMQALAGDVEAGLAMLRAHAPRALPAAQLAADAFGAVLLGLGVRPEARGTVRLGWVVRLAAWWDRLFSAGWIDELTIEHAWRALARLTVAPGAAAAACVKQVRAVAGRSAVVVGMGKNGRRVAEALGSTSLAWTARDDGVTDAPAGPFATRWRPMADAIEADAAVIVTPEQDGNVVRAIERLGVEPARIIRWADTLTTLAEWEAADIRSLLEQGGCPAASERRCA